MTNHDRQPQPRTSSGFLASLAGLWTKPGSQNLPDLPQRALGVDGLLRAARHAVAVANARNEIIEWSAGAEELFGYEAREVLGQPLSCLIAPGDKAEFEAEISRVRRDSDHPASFVLQGQKRDGPKLPVEISVSVWPTSAGPEVGVVLHDVSKQVLAERRLGEVEKNWRDIAENTSDALLLLDRVGTIIFANRGFEGRAVSEIIGSNVVELVPSLSEVLEQGLREVFVSGDAFEHEGRTERDGRPSWLWCRFAPQREDGEVVRAVLSISDIAERRARDQALRRLAGTLERTKDAVLTTDAQGAISTWNRGAELLWGYTEHEIIGKNLATLCPAELLEEQRAIFARLRDGRHVDAYDSVVIAKNRRRIPVSISAAATRSDAGKFEGVSAVVRDMSHQRELQEALQRAKSAAEAASQLKSEFLANMSHEVRTPLNGVVGMVDLLKRTPLTPEQEGYVATLLEASNALRVVVDDVLDFSKIEAGKLRLDSVEFDLITLATAAVDMFRHAATQNATALRLELPQDTPLRVLGDPNRVRQVLINLINNAVKFTKNGGVDVRVSVSDVDTVSVRVRAEVEDTGVGIAADAHGAIFQPFAQADGSATRRFSGTGLGLAICRKLMDLMGGSIGFSSEQGVGSKFWFELVLGKAVKAKPSATRKLSSTQIAAVSPVSILPRHPQAWRILVAEDNPMNQKVVSAMLNGLGASVDIAHNGREAVELWRKGQYDLILMDCQMPVMSGFEATEAIRLQQGDTHIPIVAMTAQAYAQDRERCARAGMDDHLAKPLTRSELESTLAKWLRMDTSAQAPIRSARPAPNGTTIDTARLERLQGELGVGGRELLLELIDGFFVDFQEALGRMSDAASAAAWEKLAFEAHRVRSSTGNLAAVDLSDLCRRLEECGLRPDPNVAADLLWRLGEEFARVREALSAFAQRGGAGPHTAAPRANPTPESNSVPS